MTPTIPSRRGDFDLMLEGKVCSDLCIMDHYISPGDVPSNEGISVVLFCKLQEHVVPPSLQRTLPLCRWGHNLNLCGCFLSFFFPIFQHPFKIGSEAGR